MTNLWRTLFAKKIESPSSAVAVSEPEVVTPTPLPVPVEPIVAEEHIDWETLERTFSCPVSGGRLRAAPERHELVSEKAKLAFPVKSGVPVLLQNAARAID